MSVHFRALICAVARGNMPANFPTSPPRLLFQCDAHRGLLLIAQDCDARMHSAAGLPCVPQEILRVFYRSVVEPENHVSGRQASLARRAGWWHFQHRHAGFARGSSGRNFVQSDNIFYLCALP